MPALLEEIAGTLICDLTRVNAFDSCCRGRDLLSPDKLLPWMSTTPCRRPPVSCESPSGRSAAGWSAVSSKARATPRRGGGGWRRLPSPRPCPTVRRSQLRLRGYQKPPRAPRVIGTGCAGGRGEARVPGEGMGRMEGRLELSEQAYSTLREQLERERDRADRLEEELRDARRSWWSKIFGR